MEKFVNNNYSALDQHELLKNKDSIQLYLKYGKKLGLFKIMNGTERVYSYMPAQYCLAYLIEQLVQEGGIDKATQDLDNYTHGLSVTSQEKEPDFTTLKRKIINLQRKNFTASLQSAIANNDKEATTGFKFELEKLKINESDLLKGEKITRYGFDAISPDLLPTWFVLLMVNKSLPNEIEEVLNTGSNQNELIDQTPLNKEILDQLDTSHNKALKSIKPL